MIPNSRKATYRGGEEGQVTKANRFDIRETAQKALSVLDDMERTVSPGDGSQGTRSDVLRSMKDRIVALLERGFTASQIADALHAGGVFRVPPRTITEIAMEGRKPSKKSRTGARQGSSRENRPAVTGQSTVSASGISVQPDVEPLANAHDERSENFDVARQLSRSDRHSISRMF